MIYVFDFEGFRLKTEFVVKEFAFCDLEEFSSDSKLFSPPFSWKRLNSQEKRTAAYCEKYIHQIRWSQEGTPLEDLNEVIQSKITTEDIIYVKGEYKRSVLLSILKEDYVVKNLEEIHCPKISDLAKNYELAVQCSYSRHKQHHHCALYKANIFARWLKKELKTMNHE